LLHAILTSLHVYPSSELVRDYDTPYFAFTPFH
jgi:hypothetical protein